MQVNNTLLTILTHLYVKTIVRSNKNHRDNEGDGFALMRYHNFFLGFRLNFCFNRILSVKFIVMTEMTFYRLHNILSL